MTKYGGASSDPKVCICIRYEVPEDSSTRERSVDDGNTKGLIDRLSEVDTVVLPASKKESLVFLNRTSQFKPVLAQSDNGLCSLLGVGKPLVCVQSIVTIETKNSAVEITGATASGD